VPRTPAQIVTERLAVYLGPHTATSAVKTFTQRALHITPDQLTLANAPALVDALRPMLRTLLGAGQGDAVIEQLRQELR
jgi:hypothetical protein